MKRIILLIALVALLIPAAKSQFQYWEWIDTVYITEITGTWLDVQPLEKNRPKAIGGCAWSVTVDAKMLDDANGQECSDATFNVGGSNQYISNGYVYYKFNYFSNGSLPYTLDKATMADTIKHAGRTVDTTYIVSFRDSYYGFTYPVFRITKGTCSSGYVVVTFRFYMT